MYIFILFLLGFFNGQEPASEVMLHEFHISKSMLKYNAEEQAIQISLHVFIDDFELALSEKGADSLFICTKMENPLADKYITTYLEERLQVSVDDKDIQLQYLGKEVSDDLAGVWMYLEAVEVTKPSSLKVTNRLLTEMFEDQRNIMNVSANDKQDYLMFTGDENEKTVTWK